MKKLITTCCIITAFAHTASAQIKLGIKLSPQLTWVTTESKGIENGSSRINAAYGLMLDYYFTENYAFSTELTVASFAGELKVKDAVVTRNGNTNIPEDINYTYRARYLSIPLIIKMRTNEIGYFRYYAEFGLDVSALVRGKADVKSSAINLTDVNVNNPDNADDYKIESKETPATTFDDDLAFFRTSMIIGAGIKYNIFGNTLLVAGLRYNNALTNFTVEDNWKAKMNAVSLNLGVVF
ncbi:MAG: PorT family protein [Bacteroidia bacterium]|nr:PorT family protein [Bacteroidia bacterium]MBP9688580.1 PorT family protein [Bacteroidia bacterium]